MNSKSLIPGLDFAKKNNLTQKEIEVLIPFLQKPYTTSNLAEFLKTHKKSLDHTIQRLKLKGLITLKDRDEKGNYTYQFVSEEEINN